MWAYVSVYVCDNIPTPEPYIAHIAQPYATKVNYIYKQRCYMAYITQAC